MHIGNCIIPICAFLLFASGCSGVSRVCSGIQNTGYGCSTPFTSPPAAEQDVRETVSDFHDTAPETLQVVSSEEVNDVRANKPIEQSEVASDPGMKKTTATAAPVQSPSPMFDWQTFWAGLVYSLVLPFLIPMVAWYMAILGSGPKEWICFLGFLITLAAFTTAIVFVFKGNALWLPLYLTSFAISMAFTIRMSFLKENGRQL